MDQLAACVVGVVIFTICTISHISCLHLREVRIPGHALKDSYIQLECQYELEPGETLYSVKWYKDGDEFFRYVPRDEPPGQAFTLPGVDIDADNCTQNSVALGPLGLTSTGRYRCEVSGEAPLFQTVSDHGDLAVVSLPEDGPRIAGGRSRYHVNDVARLNCTSGRSRPAASLSWFINGEPAADEELRGPSVDPEDAEGLHVSRLGLEFRVLPRHFKDGDMKIKCLATIATVYLRSNEESVEGDRPQRAPALESRDSAAQAASESRADRVQAGSDTIGQINRILLFGVIVIAAFTHHHSVSR